MSHADRSCRECGHALVELASFCQHCGTKSTDTRAGPTTWGVVQGVVVTIVTLPFALVAACFGGCTGRLGVGILFDFMGGGQPGRGIGGTIAGIVGIAIGVLVLWRWVIWLNKQLTEEK